MSAEDVIAAHLSSMAAIEKKALAETSDASHRLNQMLGNPYVLVADAVSEVKTPDPPSVPTPTQGQP